MANLKKSDDFLDVHNKLLHRHIGKYLIIFNDRALINATANQALVHNHTTEMFNQINYLGLNVTLKSSLKIEKLTDVMDKTGLDISIFPEHWFTPDNLEAESNDLRSFFNLIKNTHHSIFLEKWINIKNTQENPNLDVFIQVLKNKGHSTEILCWLKNISLLYIQHIMKTPASTCIIVESSITGLQAAKQAKFGTILLLLDQNNPNHEKTKQQAISLISEQQIVYNLDDLLIKIYETICNSTA